MQNQAETIPVQDADAQLFTGTRDVPEWVAREIQKAGGPRFRAIWGGNRLVFGPDGKTLIHPYQQNRWHLEKFLNGEWEHCYVLAHCTHIKKGSKTWCAPCFKGGGEFLSITEGWQVFIAAIHLIQKSEAVSGTAKQKAALFEREAAKDAEKQADIDAAFKQAERRTIPRSFETPLRLAANEVLGKNKGVRKMTAREVLKSMNKGIGDKQNGIVTSS